jgi:hypothetical protein
VNFIAFAFEIGLPRHSADARQGEVCAFVSICETNYVQGDVQFAIILARFGQIQIRCNEGRVVLIDLEIPKGRKTRSAAKLCVALGATLYLVMVWPYIPPAN